MVFLQALALSCDIPSIKQYIRLHTTNLFPLLVKNMVLPGHSSQSALFPLNAIILIALISSMEDVIVHNQIKSLTSMLIKMLENLEAICSGLCWD